VDHRPYSLRTLYSVVHLPYTSVHCPSVHRGAPASVHCPSVHRRGTSTTDSTPAVHHRQPCPSYTVWYGLFLFGFVGWSTVGVVWPDPAHPSLNRLGYHWILCQPTAPTPQPQTEPRYRCTSAPALPAVGHPVPTLLSLRGSSLGTDTAVPPWVMPAVDRYATCCTPCTLAKRDQTVLDWSKPWVIDHSSGQSVGQWPAVELCQSV